MSSEYIDPLILADEGDGSFASKGIEISSRPTDSKQLPRSGLIRPSDSNYHRQFWRIARRCRDFAPAFSIVKVWWSAHIKQS
jgi:hypothetical protein